MNMNLITGTSYGRWTSNYGSQYRYNPGAGELRYGSNLLRSPAPVPSYWVSKAGEPYSYLHIQLHHHRTPGLGNLPCTDQGVDELGNSDHGDIVDFVLLLT